MRTLTKRQKDIVLLVLAIIFFLVLVSYTWFQLYAPAKEENERVVNSLADQREVLFELQRQVAAKPEDVSSSTRPLQRQVPVLPLEDVLLLQLEKAEVKSNVLIRDVAFTQGLVEGLPPESIDETQTETEDPSLSLQQLLVDVQLTAASYEELDRFIREVEATERISVVQSIDFTTPEERREVETEKEPLELTVSFQAFYRPDLKELIPEVPKLDAPMPAGKEDPTAQAGEGDSE
ncbi:pilus assembly protein PilO [Sporosarcina aquimarina]|uniref:Pilus assembly protein PilO n=1 Tax=Sporosarcina aquimarina TaxID=114975 RepID=A0ABU4FY44_9BACL|nr:pilus assembly protein PilO [Sporosarcina aquimarina]MDW0109641.1 pilus assembly protein PilO [Sporosarcina aquimarina]